LLPSLASLNAPHRCDRQKVGETNSFDKSKEYSFIPEFTDTERAAALAALGGPTEGCGGTIAGQVVMMFDAKSNRRRQRHDRPVAK
jgi:hypothetical protein